MSLYCDETKHNINFGEPLWAGTREDVDFFSALCDEVINKIPEADREKIPRRDGTGLDIYTASSDRNLNGAYTVSEFTLGDFVFSLSEDAVLKYLPNHMKRFNPDKKRGRFKILRET